jgi:hypothetical protein
MFMFCLAMNVHEQEQQSRPLLAPRPGFLRVTGYQHDIFIHFGFASLILLIESRSHRKHTNGLNALTSLLRKIYRLSILFFARKWRVRVLRDEAMSRIHHWLFRPFLRARSFVPFLPLRLSDFASGSGENVGLTII